MAPHRRCFIPLRPTCMTFYPTLSHSGKAKTDADVFFFASCTYPSQACRDESNLQRKRRRLSWDFSPLGLGIPAERGLGESREAERLEPNGDPKPLAPGQRRCAHEGRVVPKRFCAGLMSSRTKTLGPGAQSFALGSRIRPLRVSARRDSRCGARGLRRRRQRSI